jgi:hypothetical protein
VKKLKQAGKPYIDFDGRDISGTGQGGSLP